MATNAPATPGYEGMLVLTVVSMAIGVTLMSLELNEYGWEAKPKVTSPVVITPISRSGGADKLGFDDRPAPSTVVNAVPASTPSAALTPAAPTPTALTPPATLPNGVVPPALAVKPTEPKNPEVAPQPRPVSVQPNGPVPSPFKLPAPPIPTPEPPASSTTPTPSPFKLPK